jgi:hypothetical protein
MVATHHGGEIIVESDEPAPSAEAPPVEAEAAPAVEAGPPELPEKYKDKTPADLVKMIEDTQSMVGRQANEIGAYRDLVTEVTAYNNQRQADPTQTETPASLDISSDDFFKEPVESTLKLLDNRIEALTRTIEERDSKRYTQSEQSRFEQEFKDVMADTTTPEFIEWGQSSATRMEAAKRATQDKDYSAASQLMTDWRAHKATIATPPDTEAPPPAPPTGVEGARQVATETSGNSSGTVVGKKIWYASEVQALIEKDPDKYKSEAFQKEYMDAIREGRYRE